MVSSRNVSEPDLNLDGGRMFGSGVLGAGGIGGVGTGMGGGADIAPWLMNDNEPEQVSNVYFIRKCLPLQPI